MFSLESKQWKYDNNLKMCPEKLVGNEGNRASFSDSGAGQCSIFFRILFFLEGI